MLIVLGVYLAVCFLSWTVWHVVQNHRNRYEYGTLVSWFYQNTDDFGWTIATLLWPVAYPIIALVLSVYYASRVVARLVLRRLR